jgi:lipocalin
MNTAIVAPPRAAYTYLITRTPFVSQQAGQQLRVCTENLAKKGYLVTLLVKAAEDRP